MFRRGGFGVLVAVGVLGTLAPACSDDEPSTLLQDLDFKQPKGVDAKFDRNDIISPAAFQDSEGIDAALIQRFFRKTSYDRSTFLETYGSNGSPAADAITRAARTYRLNPLVFLVFVQITEGLVGEIHYPFPPERVEYVFRCGCVDAGTCLPALAGLDRQLECLGRALRGALDEIGGNRETTSGWGPDKASLTLDGENVTPANEATAALYSYLPYVREGQAGGSWIFWNVWNLYASTLKYTGPSGGSGATGWIGDPCTGDGNCGYKGATCAPNYPGGACTAQCDGQCPTQPGKAEAFCASFEEGGGYCMPVCNPGTPECREGYKCLNLARYNGSGDTDAKHVCVPDFIDAR